MCRQCNSDRILYSLSQRQPPASACSSCTAQSQQAQHCSTRQVKINLAVEQLHGSAWLNCRDVLALCNGEGCTFAQCCPPHPGLFPPCCAARPVNIWVARPFYPFILSSGACSPPFAGHGGQTPSLSCIQIMFKAQLLATARLPQPPIYLACPDRSIAWQSLHLHRSLCLFLMGICLSIIKAT